MAATPAIRIIQRMPRLCRRRADGDGCLGDGTDSAPAPSLKRSLVPSGRYWDRRSCQAASTSGQEGWEDDASRPAIISAMYRIVSASSPSLSGSWKSKQRISSNSSVLILLNLEKEFPLVFLSSDIIYPPFCYIYVGITLFGDVSTIIFNVGLKALFGTLYPFFTCLYRNPKIV